MVLQVWPQTVKPVFNMAIVLCTVCPISKPAFSFQPFCLENLKKMTDGFLSFTWENIRKISTTDFIPGLCNHLGHEPVDVRYIFFKKSYLSDYTTTLYSLSIFFSTFCSVISTEEQWDQHIRQD